MSIPIGRFEADEALRRFEAALRERHDPLRPIGRYKVVDNSDWTAVGPSFVSCLVNGAAKRFCYDDGPQPAIGSYLQGYKTGKAVTAPWLAFPLPQPVPDSACGDVLMGTFVLSADSAAIGDDLFTAGTTLAADGGCFLRTLIAFDHAARFYPRMYQLAEITPPYPDHGGGIKVVTVPAGTPAGTCFPIEYAYGGTPGAAPVFEGHLAWGSCGLITQEPVGRWDASPFTLVVGDAVEVRGTPDAPPPTVNYQVNSVPGGGRTPGSYFDLAIATAAGAGWEAAGYDDTAWGATVAGYGDDACPIPGAHVVYPGAPDDTTYIRQHFHVGVAATWATVRLYTEGSGLAGAWLNGTPLAGVAGQTDVTVNAGSALLPDAINVLAVAAQGPGPTYVVDYGVGVAFQIAGD